MGGILPAIEVMEDEVSIQCAQFTLVTEEMWKSHLEDLKRNAKFNEECRSRAMRGKTLSSELLLLGKRR